MITLTGKRDTVRCHRDAAHSADDPQHAYQREWPEPVIREAATGAEFRLVEEFNTPKENHTNLGNRSGRLRLLTIFPVIAITPYWE